MRHCMGDKMVDNIIFSPSFSKSLGLLLCQIEPWSVILPVHNASSWLPACLNSILQQAFSQPFQLSIYNDASTDSSLDVINKWREKCLERNISLVLSGHDGKPGGVGFAKNKAIVQSSGHYLCFMDADDVMHENRIACQHEMASRHPKALIGCKFHREPPESTVRYTEWANSLTEDQLCSQVYTSNGPTVIMPTWFCSRQIFDTVGGFDEGGKGTPEDLIFFYKHLKQGGKVLRVDQDLLMYRYHPAAETFSITEETIWKHRVKFLEETVLSKWTHFSIWNAGKQGRKLYRSLSSLNQRKVTMFCDVDEKKIDKKFYVYEESKEKVKPKIPIVHFSQVQPPVVICIKLKLSGNFEDNLSSLNLEEGKDYVHFN